jgi:DNA processing protein
MITYNSDNVYWIWLSQINEIGPVISKLLLSVFKTPQNIYKATKNELVEIKGIGNITADIIFNDKSLVKAEAILNKCKKLNIGILTYADSLYPIQVINGYWR